MEKTDRINNLAYNLIKLINAEEAFDQMCAFVVLLNRLERPDDLEGEYFERKATSMEVAAEALNRAKERILDEYRTRPAHEDGLFPWPVMAREVQA